MRNIHRNILLLLAVAAVHLLSACVSVPAEPQNRIPEFDMADPDAELVLYFPGFQIQQGKDHASIAEARKQEELALLKQAFPAASVVFIDWKFNVPWNECLRNVAELTRELEHRLLALAPEQRARITLGGHSLGARIVIRAMAALHRHHAKVGRGLFLGAAIPADDPAVAAAVEASIAPPVVVFCPEDGVLRAVFGWIARRGSLGAYGIGPEISSQRVRQYRMDAVFTGERWLSNHWGVFYLETLRRAVREPETMETAASVPVDFPGAKDVPYCANADYPGFWQTVDTERGWRLQQCRLIPSRFRILDDRDMLRSSGGPELKSLFLDILCAP